MNAFRVGGTVELFIHIAIMPALHSVHAVNDLFLSMLCSQSLPGTKLRPTVEGQRGPPYPAPYCTN